MRETRYHCDSLFDKVFRYILISFLFFTLSIQAKSQTSIHSAEEVANAEKSFARKALETNTRQAFLEFYADDVIGFRNGNPVHVKEEWNKRKPDSSELWWQPVFADMAYSGDFGYTTGPWEWKKSKTENTPEAYGYYNSIWKKGKDGKWHVVIDIGIPTGKPSIEKNRPTAFPTIQSKPITRNYELLRKELLDVEKTFLMASSKSSNAGYDKYISNEARLYRPNNLPYTSLDDVKKALADTAIVFTFEPIDGDIASSGDMGYIYGKAKATGTYNGQPVNSDLNYMRIWKRESTGDWKIVLDVIGGR